MRTEACFLRALHDNYKINRNKEILRAPILKNLMTPSILKLQASYDMAFKDIYKLYHNIPI